MLLVTHPKRNPAAATEDYGAGRWVPEALADRVVRHAADWPDDAAYLTDEAAVTWSKAHNDALRLAGCHVDLALSAGDRVGIWLPDSPTLHIVFLAVDMADATIVSLEARADDRGLAHVLAATDADIAITAKAVNRAEAENELESAPAAHRSSVVMVDGPMGDRELTLSDSSEAALCSLSKAERAERRPASDSLFFINPTPGVTELPKCLLHNQDPSHYSHVRAAIIGELGEGDASYGDVSAPFGCRLWAAHTTPNILGAMATVAPCFGLNTVFSLIGPCQATVLGHVSIQFITTVSKPYIKRYDLPSVSVQFTGGGAVPYERVCAFEGRSGATTPQFHGSNGRSLLNRLTLNNYPEGRTSAAGGIADQMHGRLFGLYAENRDAVMDSDRVQPAFRSPATEQPNRQLFSMRRSAAPGIQKPLLEWPRNAYWADAICGQSAEGRRCRSENYSQNRHKGKRTIMSTATAVDHIAAFLYNLGTVAGDATGISHTPRTYIARSHCHLRGDLPLYAPGPPRPRAVHSRG